MKLIEIMREPEEMRRTMQHLIKIERAPPGSIQ